MNVELPDFSVIQQPPIKGDTIVIVPVYNEMPHLSEVIETILLHWDGDILAVDDNSSDGSLEALKQFPQLTIIHNHQNCGAGGVLLRAFDFCTRSGYANVITMDADGQHQPESITRFLLELEKCHCCCNCDFVWGSRYLDGYTPLSESFQPRQQINKEITSRVNELTGYDLTDVFCGFRAYRLQSLNKLEITETGYGMFLQMTIQASRKGIEIKQIPVPLIYLDDTRDFNENFRDIQHRLEYYHQVINDELSREAVVRQAGCARG